MRKDIRHGFIVMIILVLILLMDVTAVPINAADKVDDGYFYLCGEDYGGPSKKNLEGRPTKIKVNKGYKSLTVKGEIYVKINGKARKKNKLTLKISPKCKYLGPGEDAEYISKKEAKGYIEADRIAIIVIKVKNNKIVWIGFADT